MNTLIVSHDRLLSRKEAARYLNLATQTLAVWACTGRYGLPYIKIGNRVRYRLSDLEEFVKTRRVTRTPSGGFVPPRGSNGSTAGIQPASVAAIHER
ncbi:MAG: helix-turn-helix domain-containing protein [Pyrinomonadaceae bacterium]